MTYSLRNLSLSHLMALRDLGRDQLNQAKLNVKEMESKLADISMEIESRGKSKPE